jgi:transposase
LEVETSTRKECRIMSRIRLPIIAHLGPGEVARRYKACRDGLEKTNRQVVWLLTRTPEPPTPAAVAAQVGLTPSWVRTVLKRWHAEGPAGLIDRRSVSNGGRPRLSDEQRAALFEALQGRPDDGGLWSGPKVAAYVRDRWGVEVCAQTAWEWMTQVGFSLQVPRPKNPGAADAEGRGEWKRRPGRPGGGVAPRPPRQGRRALGRG